MRARPSGSVSAPSAARAPITANSTAKAAPSPSTRCLTALKEGYNVAMTADVPKVARVAGLGVVKLAQHSGRPIYPVAMASSRRIELDNWDRSAINLPFSRDRNGGERGRSVCRPTPTMPTLEAAQTAGRKRTQPGDGTRLRDRRQNRGRANLERQAARRLADVSALVRGGGTVHPHPAGAARSSAARNIVSACPNGAAKAASRGRKVRWSGCMAQASASWPACCR